MSLMSSMMKTIRFAIATVLLLLVVIHAMAPSDKPLERVTGSAFSAATIDVSLAAAQQFETERRLIGIAPVPLLPVAPALQPHFDTLAAVEPLQAWPDARGPPARPIAASPLAPRAPPVA